jgi:hypothetical protein
MENKNNILKLKKSIEEEISLFNSFLKLEHNLNESVKSKNWDNVNKYLGNLSDISIRVEKTEKIRHETFKELCSECKISRNTSFREFIDCVYGAEKDELSRLQAVLTDTIKKVRKTSIGMSSHFKYMYGTVNNLLEEIFPFRKGKIYSRQGKASEVNSSPVMINKKL